MDPTFSPLPGPKPVPQSVDLAEAVSAAVRYHTRWYKAERRARARRRISQGLVEKQAISSTPDKVRTGVLLSFFTCQAGTYYKVVSWVWRFNAGIDAPPETGFQLERPVRKSGPSDVIGSVRGFSLERLSRLKILASTTLEVSQFGTAQHLDRRTQLASEVRGRLQEQINELKTNDALSPEEVCPTSIGIASLLASEDVQRAVSNMFEFGSKVIVSITSSKHGWSLIGKQRTTLKEFTDLFYYAGSYDSTELAAVATLSDDWGEPRKAVITVDSAADFAGKSLNYKVGAAYNQLMSQWMRVIAEVKEQNRQAEHNRRVTAEIRNAAQTNQGVLDWLINAAKTAWDGMGSRHYLKPGPGKHKTGFTFEVGRSEEGAWCYRAWAYNIRTNKDFLLGEGWLYPEVGTTGYTENSGCYAVTSYRTPEDAAKTAFLEMNNKAKTTSREVALALFQEERPALFKEEKKQKTEGIVLQTGLDYDSFMKQFGGGN